MDHILLADMNMDTQNYFKSSYGKLLKVQGLAIHIPLNLTY